MVDPKSLSRWARDAIRSSYSPHGDRDAITARSLLDSHEVADAEISRLTAENASLRLDVEGARKAIEDAPHDWFKCSMSGHILPKGKSCNCWRSRALALLPAPGEPGKLMEALFEVARLQQAVDAEQGDAPVELEYELQDKVAALCALVPPEGK